RCVFRLCLHCRGDPRDLHSFPTRRSSDLARRRAERGAGVAQSDFGKCPAHDRLVGRALLLEAAHADRVAGEAVTNRMEKMMIKRSEEHTSELQSREKLVCRLLLEKKKT